MRSGLIAVAEKKMGKVRANFSPKSKYYISKHEFLQVYHFALQYPEWKAEYQKLIGKSLSGMKLGHDVRSYDVSKPTENDAIKMAELSVKIDMVEQCAMEADPTLYQWVLMAVTQEGCSYNYLRMRKNIPCGRNLYLKARKRFYYFLAKRISAIYANHE